MIEKQKIGRFSHNPHDASDQPLMVFGVDLPASFLNDEVELGKTVGEYFYLSDLETMWCDITLVKLLVKHPDAIGPLKELAERFKIKVQSVKLQDWFHFLDSTVIFLWENHFNTVEHLILNQARRMPIYPTETIKNDINSAFLSIYGVSLLPSVA